jgi:thiamine-phosphate pyrophosphorylase
MYKPQKFVLLSPETLFDKEIESLIEFFKMGLPTFHLRKPSFSKEETIDYLLKIPEEYHNRIVLHDHHNLREQFKIGGVHFNIRNRLGDSGLFEGMSNSQSIHSVEELYLIHEHLDYVFISPVWDSISKTDYVSSFKDKKSLQMQLHFWKESDNRKTELYALGGVNGKNIEMAQELGFDGTVCLGHVWEPIFGGSLIEGQKRLHDILEKCHVPGNTVSV